MSLTENLIRIKEGVFNTLTHKSMILDSFGSATAMIAISQMLEGIFKILGYCLTAILLIRGFVGLRKDYIETKIKKTEQKIKEHELKKLENEQPEQTKKVLRKIVS